MAAILSCDTSSTEPVDAYAYFPLEVGRYVIYNVREEIYSSGQANPVIKTSQEKDEIEEVSTNADGIATYTLSRSTRNSSSDYWQKVKEFTVQKFPDKILTSIDNQTFFSLVFPVDENITWNGNTYNNLEPREYHYENINASGTIGAQNFDKVLTVVERKDTSIINKYVGIKQYGLGIGLISDDQINYEFCQSEECIGSGKIESGTRKTRQIIEHGDN
ncbi:hypothetical protein [Dyadobacter sp. CY323]|uniref:hypothetical protein n=1 Tax=Dyadobacter sp. CY323 TaxID=2907302 RepID=UPI001F397956|nr:hypothetical protein [Dyadobacter sp. CY323]MCE6988227.1 hypothetical protein [Dyadobacter sp. CY323]